MSDAAQRFLAAVDARRSSPPSRRSSCTSRFAAGPSQLGYELGRARAGAGAPARGEARARARGGELQDARARRDRRAHAARHGAAAARAHRARSPPIPERSDERDGARRSRRSRGRREEPRSPARAVDSRCAWGCSAASWALGLGGIVSSAYRVQVEDGPTWREMAEKQRQRRLHVEPKRGTIYDRNGTPLAVSVEVPSVSADVVEMLRGVDGASRAGGGAAATPPRASAQVLALDAERALRASSRRGTLRLAQAPHLRRRGRARCATSATRRSRRSPIRGLTIEGEGHRYYPGRELAGPVLGFVAPDGEGKDGLELALDEELRGHVEEVQRPARPQRAPPLPRAPTTSRRSPGTTSTSRSTRASSTSPSASSTPRMRTYETKGGVARRRRSRRPARSSRSRVAPGYNPNDYAESEVDARRDRAVTDRFEPGSVDEDRSRSPARSPPGALKPTDTIYCEHGVYRSAASPSTTRTSTTGSRRRRSSRSSSNIGALKIGLALGEPGLYAAFRRFGFGEPTGCRCPGEAAGVLRPQGAALVRGRDGDRVASGRASA